jgi:hypothetical protein
MEAGKLFHRDTYHTVIRPDITKKPFKIEHFTGTKFDDGFMFAIKKSTSDSMVYMICSPTRSGVLYELNNASDYTWGDEFEWRSSTLSDSVKIELVEEEFGSVVHITAHNKWTINYLIRAIRFARLDITHS